MKEMTRMVGDRLENERRLQALFRKNRISCNKFRQKTVFIIYMI